MNSVEQIATDKAPGAVGPYSQALAVGGGLYFRAVAHQSRNQDHAAGRGGAGGGLA